MATPVEHYEHAEHLLSKAATMAAGEFLEVATDDVDDRTVIAARTRAELERLALVHATLSNAPWALDDRVLDEVAAGLDAETVGALLAAVHTLANFAETTPAVPNRADAEGYVAGLQAARLEVAALVRPALELIEAARA